MGIVRDIDIRVASKQQLDAGNIKSRNRYVKGAETGIVRNVRIRPSSEKKESSDINVRGHMKWSVTVNVLAIRSGAEPQKCLHQGEICKRNCDM
jgi:hypothetical protein